VCQKVCQKVCQIEKQAPAPINTPLKLHAGLVMDSGWDPNNRLIAEVTI